MFLSSVLLSRKICPRLAISKNEMVPAGGALEIVIHITRLLISVPIVSPDS